MPKDAPLAVEVPASNADKPAWVKVGVIAAVGFVIGIAWPRLVGVRLGPSAPGESTTTTAATANAGRAPEAPPASLAAKLEPATPVKTAMSAAPPVDAPAPPAASGGVEISVQRGNVLSCKTSDGDTKKGKDCGAIAGFDQQIAPRIRRIATCPGLEGQSGRLSVVVSADFAGKSLSYDVGKSSTVSNADAAKKCLETALHGVTTRDIAHEHARYTVAYTAQLAPARGTRAAEEPAEAPAKTAAEERPASEKPVAAGEAEVAWEIALVREAPKTGSLVARLPRSTKVKVGPAKDGWYQIKYGEGFASEGWVYRGAIGR